MTISATIIRLLTFRLTREEMLQFNRKHFIAGLIGTWIVGMGRYWDDSGANLLQHLGLGSVIYIFVLAGFVWLILKPFQLDNWNYFTVLTFIGLTSFPAIFYAIPVEQFFTIRTANSMNVWFLAIVAAWRLRLLYYFLKHFARLSKGDTVTVTLMPICLIISTLTALNLHRVVFQIMGGIREPTPTPHDSSYLILMLLTGISMFLTLPLLLSYGLGVYRSRKMNKVRSYKVTVPFVEANFIEIAQALNQDIDLGAYAKGEEAFAQSDQDELLYTLINLPDFRLKILFVRYEGYFDVEVEGKREQFNAVAQYLLDHYMCSGGNIRYLTHPDYF